MRFQDLREKNSERLGQIHSACLQWTIADWACAVGGECGELLNKIKKLRRGDDIKLGDVADEMADTVIYLDLLASELGIDLAQAVRNKFNRTSAQFGVDILL